MANLLSHPFRLDPNNRVVTVDQDGDQYLAERISIITQTRPGERLMSPDFGIDDPVYGEINLPDLELQFEMFDLPIVVDEMIEQPVNDGKTEYEIRFHREELSDDEYDEEEED